MGQGEQGLEPALAYQRRVLPDVSRTFALTIPELPPDLELAVGNAYLLCRIADAIEDDPAIDDALRSSLHEGLIAVLAGDGDARLLAERAASALSDATIASERQLVADLPRVVTIYGELGPTERAAILTCVTKMCQGMPEFQHADKARGLHDLAELDRYCYHVAGVVGELLTELFSAHSPQIARHRDSLFALAASFGQGLQLTNIIKDVWDDHARGYCWLPRDLFLEHGYDLDDLAPDHERDRFRAAMEALVGIAHGHLRQAFRYTLMIPPAESGIRRFCLWAIGLALLTLRKVRSTPGYACAADVKVSRRTVAAVILATRLTVRSDRALQWLFRLAANSLPRCPEPMPPLTLETAPGRVSR